MNIHKSLLKFAAVAGAALMALTGCATNTASTMADAITVSDPWVKAGSAGGMVGAFAELENTSDAEVEIVAVTSPSSPRVEMHEMAMNDAGEMKMREIDGGFVIPADEDFDLQPGGYHIMLMELPADIVSGNEVKITLEFADGSKKEFTALVKDYSAGNEEYIESGESGMNHSGSDMEMSNGS